MKKTIAIFITVLIAYMANAQTDNSKGQIIYETVRQLQIKVNGGDASQFEHMLPKERKTYKELIFNADASLYHQFNDNQEDEDVTQETSGGANVLIKIAEPNEIIFSDLKSKINFEQREFMTRTFLIETKTDTAQWKLTGNQKSIMEHNCLEAELIGAKRKTMAWFTPEIPISTGPDGYVGLPGLILAMDIDNGKIIYNAQVINLKEIDSSLLVKPSEGKKVTRKEFNKIVDEKRKEMNLGQGGDGATVIIRTR
ncbi:MAG: GLPGLI family protein [Bacteroidales bacterium]|nr:GLPGLI family protein [Bacteroidales bacterium]